VRGRRSALPAKEQRAAIRDQRIQPAVMPRRRNGRDHLQVEPQRDGGGGEGGEQGIVEPLAAPEAVSVEGKRGAGNQHHVRFARVHPGSRIGGGLRNPERAGVQRALIRHEMELEPARTGDPGQRDQNAGTAAGPQGLPRIGFAAYRRIGQHQAGMPDGRQARQARRDPPVAMSREPRGLGQSRGPDRSAQGALRLVEPSRVMHRVNSNVAVLVLMAGGLSGCLPLLLGSARTMPPGDLSLALAGSGRSASLPAGVAQAGPATGLVELRGGLPPGRLEAGFTLQIPWTMMWDFKVQVLEESLLVPAVAGRLELGLVQPDYGGELLATKTAGPIALTVMGGRNRTYERLWRTGTGSFSDTSESYVKSVWTWGVGAEYLWSPLTRLFLELVAWNPDSQKESPKTGAPFGVNERPSLAVSAGVRFGWHLSPRRAPEQGAVTALRGYVLNDPTEDAFEVGQPGIFHATVLLDTQTRFIADGKPVDRSALARGRAVLIQGLAMPRPSTFLARVIELQ